MKVFMPAIKERPSLLIPCAFCQQLHIPLDIVYSGKTIFCPNADDKPLSCDYYSDLLQGRVTYTTTKAGKQYSLIITTYIIDLQELIEN